MEGGEEVVIGRAMRWRREAVTSYCRLRGGKGIGRWLNKKIGWVDNAECPRCGEEEETPDHIVFWCRKVRRVEDERGRREWAGMRWDSWDALASKKWMRMEDSGRVDDEGRPILERVDLMEAFSRACTVKSRCHVASVWKVLIGPAKRGGLCIVLYCICCPC